MARGRTSAGTQETSRPAAAEPEAASTPLLEGIGLDSPAVRSAPVAIYSVDLRGTVLSWNPAAEQLFGWTATETIGRPVPMLDADDLAAAAHALDELLAGSGVLSAHEYRPVCRDGSRPHVLTSAALVRDGCGTPVAVVAFAVDVTAEREASEVVADAEHRWRTLLEATSDTVTVVDAEGRILFTSGEFVDVLGYDSDWWSGTVGFDMLHPDDRPQAERIFAEVLAQPGRIFRTAMRVRHRSGHHEMVEFTAVNRLDDPVVGGIVVTTRNVTDIVRNEVLLADEAKVLELIARGGGLAETLAAIARMVESHTLGRAAIFLLPEAAPPEAGQVGDPRLLATIGALAEAGVGGTCAAAIEQRATVVVADVALDELTGPSCAALLDAGIAAAWSQPVTDTHGEDVLGTIAVYYDRPRHPEQREEAVVATASHLAAIAVERDRTQRDLLHRARHDAITGLPNRTAITEAVGEALARVDGGASVALVLIDIDRFKVVNDSLGHAVGDEVLVAFGRRLRSLVSERDYVGHFGADEFLVVLENVRDADDVRVVTSRLDLALTEPFTVPSRTTTGPNQIFLSASIGVALSSGRSETAQELVQHAEAAMYRAKERGRDRLEIFDSTMRESADEALRVDRELRLAVERAQLRLHYQPKVEVYTGRVVGVEALLRWMHPSRGVVLPAEFIRTAEESGLIVRIGGWVIEEAVRQARTWVDRISHLDRFSVAVNLAARQLTSPGLVAEVAQVLRRHRWPAGDLTLELTESVLIDDTAATVEVIEQLKDLGVKLAIDDFGTGYSSLSYLHRFPVDLVKIDRAFVSTLQADGNGSPIATAVVSMARALGLATGAEGVEEMHQLEGLRAIGCELAQGFYFSEALPPEAISAGLAQPDWAPLGLVCPHR